MSRLKAGLIVAVVFICGAVAGAYATRQVFWYALEKILAGDEGINESLVLNKLSADLNLSRRQIEQLRPIVIETFRDLYELRARQRPELDGVFLEGIRKAKEHLNQEQQGKLDELFARTQELRSVSDLRVEKEAAKTLEPKTESLENQ